MMTSSPVSSSSSDSSETSAPVSVLFSSVSTKTSSPVSIPSAPHAIRYNVLINISEIAVITFFHICSPFLPCLKGKENFPLSCSQLSLTILYNFESLLSMQSASKYLSIFTRSYTNTPGLPVPYGIPPMLCCHSQDNPRTQIPSYSTDSNQHT